MASILTDGKSSRLYKPLVYEQKIAKDVFAYQVSHALSSYFVVGATVAPGQDVNQVRVALEKQVRIALSTPASSDEFNRVVNAWRKSFYGRIEGVMSRAQSLSNYKHLLGSANQLDFDLARYTSLSAQSVFKAGQKWLKDHPFTVQFVPKSTQKQSAPDRSKTPSLAKAKAWSPPKVDTWTTEQGLNIWYLKQDQAPLISLRLIIDGGGSADPEKKAGLTSLMVNLLDEGAGDLDALGVSEAFQRLATDFQSSTSTDSIGLGMHLLAEQLVPSLELFTVLLTRPTFNQADFDRVKKQTLSSLLAQEANPQSALSIVMRRVLFGEGYSGYSPQGIKQTVESITLDEIKAQYQAHIKPKGATLVVTGSVDKATLQAALKKTLSQWTGEPKVALSLVAQPHLPQSGIHWIDFPGSTQSAIALARRVAGEQDAKSPYGDELYNRLFGGQFTSRLNLNLREDKGYTYGARSALYRFQSVGMFSLTSMVKGDTTLPSLQESFKELTEITTSRPVSKEEVDVVRSGLIKGLPNRFERLSSVAYTLSGLRTAHRSPSWFNEWLKGIGSASLNDVQNSAYSLATPSAMEVVVAGDRSQYLKQVQDALKRTVYIYSPSGHLLETVEYSADHQEPKKIPPTQAEPPVKAKEEASKEEASKEEAPTK
jgi:zinc protease